MILRRIRLAPNPPAPMVSRRPSTPFGPRAPAARRGETASRTNIGTMCGLGTLALAPRASAVPVGVLVLSPHLP
jgi:hypothetical protein